MDGTPDIGAAVKAAAAAWGGVTTDPPQKAPPPVSVTPPQSTGQPSPGTPPGMSPVDRRALGEALVALVDGFTPLAVRGWTTLRKVKWEKEFDKLTTLTAAERQSLMLTAPMAAPFVYKLLEKSDAIGAVFFAGSYLMIVKNKVDAIAPPKVKETDDAGSGDATNGETEVPAAKPRGRPRKSPSPTV